MTSLVAACVAFVLASGALGVLLGDRLGRAAARDLEGLQLELDDVARELRLRELREKGQ